MPDGVPSRQPPSQAERQRIMAEGQAGGSLRGNTRWARRIGAQQASAPIPVTGFAVVEHGDDPDVPRPLAAVVRWAGAATPNNAIAYDDWYPANVVDD